MKLTKPTYHYFVSYVFSPSNGVITFGCSKIVRETPILAYEDLFGISKDLSQNLKIDFPVTILNYIRLED